MRMKRNRRRMMMMSRRWRGRGGKVSGGHPGGGGGHGGKIFLGPFCHLSASPAALASRFFLPRKSEITTL